MGGAAGHIEHVWEADLTFQDLKILIVQSLSGKLKNVTEKLDGQNLLVTFRDGKVLSSRSTKHLKNFGEDAMNVDDMRKYFDKRKYPKVGDIYVNAMNDLQMAFENQDLDKIFEDGKNWLNIEILSTETENVIPYNSNQLRIHHMRELDEKGKIVGIHDVDFIDELDETEHFSIKKTNSVTIKDISGPVDKFVERLEILQGDLTNKDTIKDFVEIEMLKFVKEELKDTHDEIFFDLLAKRWAKGIKKVQINTLLKEQPEIVKDWVKFNDKKANQKVKGILEPLVLLLTKMGVSILGNLEGIATNNPQQSVREIKDKVNKALKHLSKTPDKDINEFNILFEKMGGGKTIVPTEGIVFEFNGKLLKISGSFIPILRIIGYHKFG